MKKTVTIPEKEYKELLKLKHSDRELIKQLIESLEDVKAGRVKRVL